MSTVPEVLVAVHAGMRVLGLSIVTDLCLPDALKPANIDEIIAIGRRGRAEAAEDRAGGAGRAMMGDQPMESQFIAWLRERLPPHPLLHLGPGDDAAVLGMAGADECVVTVDLLTDHVDFELAHVDPRRVGRKSLAVNLSDLAAMASKPLAAVIALGLPRQGGKQLAVATLRRPAAAGRAI